MGLKKGSPEVELEESFWGWGGFFEGVYSFYSKYGGRGKSKGKGDLGGGGRR